MRTPLWVGKFFDVSQGCEVRVRVWLDGSDTREGSPVLFLHRKRIYNPSGADSLISYVTREGLLRLSQGPFETGFTGEGL